MSWKQKKIWQLDKKRSIIKLKRFKCLGNIEKDLATRQKKILYLEKLKKA